MSSTATMSTTETIPTKHKVLVADGELKPEMMGFLRKSDPNEPIEVLRKRYEEDNYIYIKGLLPREHALKLRETYFRYLSLAKVSKPGTAPVEGIFDPENDMSNFGGLSSHNASANQGKSEQAIAFTDLTVKAHYEKWYAEEFSQHPNLINFVKKLTQWEDVRQFKRSLLRVNIPNSKPIGVHYDQIHLRQGEPSNLTAWCVLGDIKVNGGGLMYLEKSSRLGEEIEAEFTKRGVENGLTQEEAKSAYNRNMIDAGGLSTSPAEFAGEHNRRWLVSDYEAGDVVFHNPFAIHASAINTDPENVMRLSTDLRFYDASRPYDKRWTNFYTPEDEV